MKAPVSELFKEKSRRHAPPECAEKHKDTQLRPEIESECAENHITIWARRTELEAVSNHGDMVAAYKRILTNKQISNM